MDRSQGLKAEVREVEDEGKAEVGAETRVGSHQPRAGLSRHRLRLP